MSTRAQIIAARLNATAQNHGNVAQAMVLVCILMALLGVGASFSALMAGPIGPQLQDAYLAFGVSRLVVVQWSACAALVFAMIAVIVVACWRDAPQWLQKLCMKPLAQHVAQRFEKGFQPGSLTVYGVVVAIAGLWVNYAMLWDLPWVACLQPDTVGYLQPSMIRSAGYMFFIDAVVALMGDLRWLVPLQLNVMLFSFAMLGLAVRHTVGSFGAALVVALAPMLSSAILILPTAIMTEALFAAFICLHLAGVVWALRSPSWWALGLAGVALGIMILLRPNGISFVFGVPFLIYVLRPYWRRILVAMALPVVVMVVLQGAYNAQTFGFFGLHKFGGVSLVGNFYPLIDEDMGGAYPEMNAKLAPQLRRYARDFPPFAERDYPYEMAHIASLTAAGSIYFEILPFIRKELNIPEPKVVAFEQDQRINEVAGALAKAAVLNDPWGAFQIITSNFIAIWHKTLPVRVPMSIYYPRCLKMGQELVAQHPELYGAHMDVDVYQSQVLSNEIKAVGGGGIRTIEYPRLLISVLQMPLAYFAMVLALIGFVMLLIKGPKFGRVGRVFGFGALSLCSGYGLISVGNAAFTRYSVVFDPVVIMLLMSAAVGLLTYLYQTRSE